MARDFQVIRIDIDADISSLIAERHKSGRSRAIERIKNHSSLGRASQDARLDEIGRERRKMSALERLQRDSPDRSKVPSLGMESVLQMIVDRLLSIGRDSPLCILVILPPHIPFCSAFHVAF